MAFYEINLAILVVLNAVLQYKQSQWQKQGTPHGNAGNALDQESEKEQHAYISQFKLRFFPAYALIVAADWLQGPHIYALYRYQNGLPEQTVAALYASGFIAAAISASFVGQLADRHGRRAACLVYCVSYSLCCLSMLSGNLAVLFVGRLCGGLSTTLLFSVFETWVMTEYHQQDLETAGLDLSNLCGSMAIINSMVAIFSGIFGEALVAATGTRVSPFMASVICLVAAFAFISRSWTENYGSQAATEHEAGETSFFKIEPLIKDKRLLSLAIVSCCFEGGMYLWIFFWSAALSSARSYSHLGGDIPFGLIFSCFMCAMMLGSQLFTNVKASHDVASALSALMTAVTLASCCYLLSALLQSEELIFWTFCLLEACIGAYLPSMGYLKGEIVEDGVRGKVYGMLRLPLNVFVVVTHSLSEEGNLHRNNVFLTCGGILILAYIIGQRFLA